MLPVTLLTITMLLKTLIMQWVGLRFKSLQGKLTARVYQEHYRRMITNGYPVNEWYLKTFQGFDQNGNQTYGDVPVYVRESKSYRVSRVQYFVEMD